MELTDELKEKIKNVKSREEAEEILRDSGVVLSDDDLDQASGGGDWEISGLWFGSRGGTPMF